VKTMASQQFIRDDLVVLMAPQPTRQAALDLANYLNP